MNEDRIKKIEEKISQLKVQKQSILNREKQKERKARTRHLIQIGALFEIAGLDKVDKGILLGSLLELVKTIDSNPEIKNTWKRQGDLILKEREEKRKVAEANKKNTKEDEN